MVGIINFYMKLLSAIYTESLMHVVLTSLATGYIVFCFQRVDYSLIRCLLLGLYLKELCS